MRSRRIDLVERIAAIVVALLLASIFIVDESIGRYRGVVAVLVLAGTVCVGLSGFFRDVRLSFGGVAGLLGGFVVSDLSGGVSRELSPLLAVLVFVLAELSFASTTDGRYRGDDATGVDHRRALYYVSVIVASLFVTIGSLDLSPRQRPSLILQLGGVLAALVVAVAIISMAVLPSRRERRETRPDLSWSDFDDARGTNPSSRSRSS